LLQSSLRSLLVFFYCGACLLNLYVRSLPCLHDRGSPGLEGTLTALLLRSEHGKPRLTEPLLVFGSTGLGGSDVGPRLLDCTLGLAPSLGQDSRQGPVHEHRIYAVNKNHEDDGRDRPEQ
jgi:hypothetical protein